MSFDLIAYFFLHVIGVCSQPETPKLDNRKHVFIVCFEQVPEETFQLSMGMSGDFEEAPEEAGRFLWT